MCPLIIVHILQFYEISLLSCVSCFEPIQKVAQLAQGGGLPKANFPYKNRHFPYMISEQGGGGPKSAEIERTYFLNPLFSFNMDNKYNLPQL